jgi:rhodanese-related sulfurtransferase
MKTRILTVTATLALALGAGGALARAQDHSGHADHAAKAEAGAVSEMTGAELKARLEKGEKVVIVDARKNLAGQKLKNAVHVPTDKLAAWAETVDKNTVIVSYCTCPHDEAAINQVSQLRAMGFANAYALKGGMAGARDAGIEVVAPAADE